MIGVKGSLRDTKILMDKVRVFLDSINLSLSAEKTKITNLNSDKCSFLGAKIGRARKYTFSRPAHNNILKRNSKAIRLEVSLERITNKLKESGFFKGRKPYPKMV